jgi:hypothetical protein
MIALKEWMSESHDEEVRKTLGLTDEQYEIYCEILTGEVVIPDRVYEEVKDTLKLPGNKKVREKLLRGLLVSG